jgi:hypothetical protein
MSGVGSDVADEDLATCIVALAGSLLRESRGATDPALRAACDQAGEVC